MGESRCALLRFALLRTAPSVRFADSSPARRGEPLCRAYASISLRRFDIANIASQAIPVKTTTISVATTSGAR